MERTQSSPRLQSYVTRPTQSIDATNSSTNHSSANSTSQPAGSTNQPRNLETSFSPAAAHPPSNDGVQATAFKLPSEGNEAKKGFMQNDAPPAYDESKQLPVDPLPAYNALSDSLPAYEEDKPSNIS